MRMCSGRIHHGNVQRIFSLISFGRQRSQRPRIAFFAIVREKANALLFTVRGALISMQW